MSFRIALYAAVDGTLKSHFPNSAHRFYKPVPLLFGLFSIQNLSRATAAAAGVNGPLPTAYNALP
jgi:hypothetical protein